MNKLVHILNLFRKGYAVANPEAWKNGQITANLLASVFVSAVAVAEAFGFILPFSNEEALTLAGAVLIVVGLFNPIATVVSSPKVGLPAKPQVRNQGSVGLRGQSD